MNSFKKALTPVPIGQITLANRLVMAPMTRNRATETGEATDLMVEYYAQRASAGLMITEGIQPNQIGQGFINTPGLYSESHVESWRKVTDAVHAAKGRIFAQLMHAGRIGHPSLYASAHQPVGPSRVAAKGQQFTPLGSMDYLTPHELSLEEIRQTCADFVYAAKNAIKAGFDGVEIHAGNGFLLHQFMAQNVNNRTDVYGGCVENRIRLTLEITNEICNAIGPEQTGIRISPANSYNDIEEGDTNDIYNALINGLPQHLAYVHIMEAGNRHQTLVIRDMWRGTLILNPHADAQSFPASAECIEPVLSNDVADAVSVGSLFLANPDFVFKFQHSHSFNLPDATTFYGGGAEGYTDYATVEHAKTMPS